MNKGDYYISSTFEVIQHQGCGGGQDALIAKCKNKIDALNVLNKTKYESNRI